MLDKQIAKCEQGMLRGVPGRNGDITVFKGVPYARPPICELRWQAPQPPQPWAGIRPTDHFGAMAVQTEGYFGSEAGKFSDKYRSEDCLYLNIWTPARSWGDKLPVLVWFHGGAFQGGLAHEAIFDGEKLAQKGVLVVTVGYRVGLMGFFCHPDMHQEAPFGVSGNFGVMDQAAALQWVHANIAAFGGDPDSVTIDGQSAGGMSVCNMMCSPLATGFFQRAICQSGDALMNPFAESMQEAETFGLQLAAHFSASSLDELRKLPADAFVRPDYDAASAATGHGCAPVVDGVVIPTSQPEMALKGLGSNRVPMIIGSNADEGFGQETLAQYMAQLKRDFSDCAAKFLALYPAANDAEASILSVRLASEQWFARIRHWALVRSENLNAPTWHYRFTRPVTIRGQQVGAVHSAEIAFVFQNFDLIQTSWPNDAGEPDFALSELISDYWVNFVKYGNPNASGLPVWDSKSSGIGHMQLDLESGMKGDLFNERISFLCEALNGKY